MVSAVATAFGFNAPPAEFAKLSSKEFVGGLIPEHVPAETCVLLNDGDFEISWLTPGIKNDVVLKPSVGSGAVATMLLTIAANEDPSSVIKSAILGSGIDQPESTAWIVQAHCEGDLVSMEGFAQDGQVVFLGLSKRNRVGFTEVANQFPANEMIGLTVRSKIETAVCDLIARAEFDNGFFHASSLLHRPRLTLSTPIWAVSAVRVLSSKLPWPMTWRPPLFCNTLLCYRWGYSRPHSTTNLSSSVAKL